MTREEAPPLLLVDPDRGIRDSLGEQLEQEGFATIRLAALTDGDAEHAAALVLLGPGAIDAAALDRWRGVAPIVALIDGDPAAAADHAAIAARLPRPVRIAELVALIRTLIRERDAGAERPIGPYLFQPAAKLLRDRRSARTVRLTEKEVAMLELLYRAGGEGMTRERLLAEIWGYSRAVTTHTLETHIYRLRQKIERDPADAQILLTDAGGYRLVP